MKKRERDRLLTTYGRLYHWHIPPGEGRHKCFYCGDFAGTADHCPPLSWLESQTTEAWARMGVPFVLISSCSDCNKRLGDRPMFTALERTEYLKAALEQRYEKESTLWSEDELAEMSSEFQRTIKARQAKTKELLVRARHAQWRVLQEESFPEEPVT